jgi:hypothetical protein
MSDDQFPDSVSAAKQSAETRTYIILGTSVSIKYNTNTWTSSRLYCLY